MLPMTWPIWAYTLLSVLGISLLSFAGVVALAAGRRQARSAVFVLVGLAVGAMLGDTFLHLLPEAFERTRAPLQTSLWCLAGFVLFFVLEKFLLWHHDHAVLHTHPIHPFGYINLVADALHNFIDGVLVGTSYLVSIPIGLATTIAVCLHEIPQEIGDFGVLVHAGFSRGSALRLNFLTAAFAMAGAVLALLVGARLANFSEIVVPLTAGGFIYIAGSDLVPELHKERHPNQAALQLAAIGAGIGVMLLLTLLD